MRKSLIKATHMKTPESLKNTYIFEQYNLGVLVAKSKVYYFLTVQNLLFDFFKNFLKEYIKKTIESIQDNI